MGRTVGQRRHQFACALAVALAIGIGAPAVHAESPDTASVHSLKAGAWAMQFGISDNFTLTNFNGGSISLKCHITDRSAIRLGVAASADASDSDSRQTYLPADTLWRKTGRSDSRQSISLLADYVSYPLSTRRMNLFLGVGPTVSFQRARTDDDRYVAVRDTTTVSETDYDVWSVGAVGSCGVEWFATPDISLHAEYRASLVYRSMDDIRASPSYSDLTSIRDDRSSSGVSLSLASVKFGLSAYF
jgi:hypothetical protein